MQVAPIPSQGIIPPPQPRNSPFNPTITRCLFDFSMPMDNREYPYGISTSMMDVLYTNMLTYRDNAMATKPSYKPHNASASTINNMVRPGGIGYICQVMPSLNTMSMMSMRQQMDESNLEMVNTLTQQMGTIFNPLIININQAYELLANQMGRVAYFFGMPQVQARQTA